MNDTYDNIPSLCVVGAPSSSTSYCPTRTRNPRKKRTKLITVMDDNHHHHSPPPLMKPKHYKKPDPGAPKITRPCTECGKKFWSWKALFGHMRCHPERQWRGINPPPDLLRPQPQPPPPQPPPQHFDMSEEDHEVAASLLLLASSGAVNKDQNVTVNESPIIINQQQAQLVQERFECSSCKKVFGSHQALGGHRASHKNVKGCFAITKTDGDHVAEDMDMMNMMMVVHGGGHDDQSVVFQGGHHQCSICLRVFSTGQALGGHKRCHWEKGEINESSSSIAASLAAHAPPKEEEERFAAVVDLNLPAATTATAIPNSPSALEDDHCSSSHLTLDLRLGL